MCPTADAEWAKAGGTGVAVGAEPAGAEAVGCSGSFLLWEADGTAGDLTSFCRAGNNGLATIGCALERKFLTLSLHFGNSQFYTQF